MANLLNLDWRESNEVLFAEKAALANGSAVIGGGKVGRRWFSSLASEAQVNPPSGGNGRFPRRRQPPHGG